MLMPLARCASSAAGPLLDVRDLEVRTSAGPGRYLSTLTKINFQIAPGEIVGLIGESGAGKTTLALALLRLLSPSSTIVGGSIHFASVAVLAMSETELRKVRGANISIVYQDATVLNPIIRVGKQVVEVLRAHRDWAEKRCRDESRQLLAEMGFDDVDRIYDSYPHQLSGGQRQRIVVALAIACRPVLVIADEPTASLDPGTTLAIIERFKTLNRRFDTAFLIISHDIAFLTRFTDRIMVMYAGRIVEQGPSQKIGRAPLHPYTRALLNCALPDSVRDTPTGKSYSFATIPGNAFGPGEPASHCNFESRCPERTNICSTSIPKEVLAAHAHSVACFNVGTQ
jgi:oligopeptide/dipeptide ABC transporter ATP-binding protein